jgi:hypothetical protein
LRAISSDKVVDEDEKERGGVEGGLDVMDLARAFAPETGVR